MVEGFSNTEETVKHVNDSIEKIRNTVRKITRESLALKEYNIAWDRNRFGN